MGSGSWINRVPSGCESADGAWELDGYMCIDCQSMECDACGHVSAEWTMDQDGITCADCAEGREVLS
jgi:hypothetical protein